MTRRGASLIELLTVVSIIAALIAILLPALNGGRLSAMRMRCAAHLRNLEVAQLAYAAGEEDLLIAAGDGTVQGSWIGPLEAFGALPEARRCPLDRSRYFDEPLPSTNPPRLRSTSYGVNDYLSPTHAPFGATPLRKVSQVARSASVIHLGELAEIGAYAGSDHIHAEDFYIALAPQLSIALIDKQLSLGRHGGRPQDWDAVLNFAFLDGHAESLSIRRVYSSPTLNLFLPSFESSTSQPP
ncbi:MAG: hypothetical protein U1A27_08930 [Phycisphaerae bacterium]